MKKIILTLFAIAALAGSSLAQTRDAFGVRLGYGSFFNGELSYQKCVGGINRVETDLGIDLDGEHIGATLSAIYQWHWNLSGGLGFYVGPGAQADIFNSHFGIGAGGQIGLDYQFNAPVQLSLDVRPMWNFIGHVTGFNYGAALGIRYAF